ncbi:MAG: hypothetical protein M3R70_10330 [Actinomycetota bacterium]|nr:hypothetical protein [Actinomycetota bacterium]
MLTADARLEPPGRTLLLSVFPSTASVAILAGIALAFSKGLTALLGGVLVGMGVFTLVWAARILAWERAEHADLLFERSLSAHRFRAPRES